MGKVYIASMNMRGKWAPRPPGAKVINVTSAQGKDSSNRRAFSPMSSVTGGYKGFYCFENYWQAGKVHEGLDHQKIIQWWKELKTGKRRYPSSKGKKTLHADYGDGKKRSYIEARKEVYVHEYHSLIKDKEETIYWKKYVQDGNDVVVFDFDGPRDEGGEPICKEVTKELLIEKINYSKHPFGHGYVVAAELAGIQPQAYAVQQK